MLAALSRIELASGGGGGDAHQANYQSVKFKI